MNDEEILAVFKDAVRPLCVELVVSRVVMNSLKQADPAKAAVIDALLESLPHNADIAKEVDLKLAQSAAIWRTLQQALGKSPNTQS